MKKYLLGLLLLLEKLSFDENPVLKIKDVTVEVNSDAATVLKIMGIFSKGTSAKEVLAVYELIFNEKDRKKIDKLNLQFKDFQTIIMLNSLILNRMQFLMKWKLSKKLFKKILNLLLKRSGRLVCETMVQIFIFIFPIFSF